MCQQISFTNTKTLDENCLSVDQHLHSHPAPWCSSTPHIRWIRRPIQVKRKHEHKTGQCAPIHLHSTQNDEARSLAAAANSSCCIIRPIPQPSMPNYCPLILLRHEEAMAWALERPHCKRQACAKIGKVLKTSSPAPFALVKVTWQRGGEDMHAITVIISVKPWIRLDFFP